MMTTAERIEHATPYGVGTKAYVDSFAGMIPCVVTEIHKPNANGIVIGQEELTVRIEETRGGYAKGEIVKRSAAYTPPRKQRILRGYSYRINTAYKYV